MIRFFRLQSYCWETTCQSFTSNFFVHPVEKNYSLYGKMIVSFIMGTMSSTTMQSLDEIELAAIAKIRCSYVCLSCSKAGALFILGGHSLNNYCVAIIARIWCCFQCFFRRNCPFRCNMSLPIFVARWCHNFQEILVKILKNYEKSKNRQKVCAHHFVYSWQIWIKFHRCCLEPRM